MCKFTEKAAPYELKRLLKELFLKDKFWQQSNCFKQHL